MNNKYFPKDTQEILQHIIDMKQFENFSYLFNMLNLHKKLELPEKTKINEILKNYRWNQEFLDCIVKKGNILSTNY